MRPSALKRMVFWARERRMRSLVRGQVVGVVSG